VLAVPELLVGPVEAAGLAADEELAAGTPPAVPDPDDPPQLAMHAASRPNTAMRTASIIASPEAELPLDERQLAPSIERARRLGSY